MTKRSRYALTKTQKLAAKKRLRNTRALLAHLNELLEVTGWGEEVELTLVAALSELTVLEQLNNTHYWEKK